jgi:uncharacterized SAM-binding protein YcdF (DUF218 family)
MARRRRRVTSDPLSVKQFCLRGAAWMAVLGVLAGIAASMPLIGFLLIDTLQVYPAIEPNAVGADAGKEAQAIVVLSAGRRRDAPEFGGDTLDAAALERVRYAALLARRTGLPVLASGGEVPLGRPTLAALIEQTLRTDYGIERVWTETQSRTTAENAIFSAAMLRSLGISRVLLVTHAWHMPRAKTAFEANRIEVVAAPTAFATAQPITLSAFMPALSALRLSADAAHEWIGLAWYRLHYGYRWRS